MEDIGSFAIWTMIVLLIINAGISTIGGLDFFNDNGLNPGMKPFEPVGVVSGIALFLDDLVGGLTGTNYVSSETPQISQDVMPRTNATSNGLFSSFVSMFYGWQRIVVFFADALGEIGVILYIFTSFIEIIQLVGLFVLLSKVATIAKLIIPFGG